MGPTYHFQVEGPCDCTAHVCDGWHCYACCVPRLEYWPKRRRPFLVLLITPYNILENASAWGRRRSLVWRRMGRAFCGSARRRDSIAMTGTASRTLAGPKACRATWWNWFGGAGRERLGAVAQGIARQVHEHFEAIHLPAEADALRTASRVLRWTGTEAFSWPRRAACCGCNRIAGAINCSAAEVLQWRARSMLWLGRRTTRSVCGKKQDWALSAGKIRTRECRGA